MDPEFENEPVEPALDELMDMEPGEEPGSFDLEPSDFDPSEDYGEYAPPEPYGGEEGDLYDDDYARRLEERVIGQVGGYLENIFAPLQQLYAMSQLGGQEVAEYVEGLSPQDLSYVANHPGLSRALREAAAAKGGRARAPRAESWEYGDDEPILTHDLQREIDEAYPAYADAFGVSKAQFTKIVLSKQRGGY